MPITRISRRTRCTGSSSFRPPRRRTSERSPRRTRPHVKFDPHEKFSEVQLTTCANCRQMGSGRRVWEGTVGLLPVSMEFESLLPRRHQVQEDRRDEADSRRLDAVRSHRPDGPGGLHPICHGAAGEGRQRGDRRRAARTSSRAPAHSVRFSGTRCELRESCGHRADAPGGGGGVRQQRATAAAASARRPRSRSRKGRSKPKMTLYLHNPSVQETGQLLVPYGVADLMLPEAVGRGLSGSPLLNVVTADLAAQLEKAAERDPGQGSRRICSRKIGVHDEGHQGRDQLPAGVRDRLRAR